MWFRPAQALAALTLLTPTLRPYVQAVELDITQPESIKKATSNVAKELWSYYAVREGNGWHINGGYPGVIWEPYYWWMCGGMFGTLLDYWRYTGDSQYNDMIREGMIHQMGENLDLRPQNQSKNEGNDDQAFWAFTMMSAAEYKFPDPPDDKPGWLAITQSVFNQFTERFEKEVKDGNCGGGMRWQMYPWNKGFTYKNTASNGALFHLAARLAMYTHDDKYAKWAEKAYDWMNQSPLLGDNYEVYDGTSMDTPVPCSEADRNPWSYNYGMMISGAAYMYNFTNGADKWQKAVSGFLRNSEIFYPKDKGGVMIEFCELKATCNEDQESFKAYLARWLAVTTQMAPFTRDQIMPRLQTSAKAAAQTCTGASDRGAGNFACGMRWWNNGFDNVKGLGQQIAALNVMSVLLVDSAPPPYTSKTGGTSKGDENLGKGSENAIPDFFEPVTTADRAGAAILTILVVVFWIGGAWWLLH